MIDLPKHLRYLKMGILPALGIAMLIGTIETLVRHPKVAAFTIILFVVWAVGLLRTDYERERNGTGT